VSSRAQSLVLHPELAARLVSLERLTEARGRRPTGITTLDGLLGGGWPRAALSEISGRRSSGRTAILRAALAAAIAAGEAAALVDTGGTLDARAAAASGLALPALLWIRCAPAQALKATDLVVAAGGFGMAVLDLCDARLRVPDAAWVRLRHAARAQGTTVLVATGARRLGSFAAAAIELDDGRPAFFGPPPLFAGLGARATRARGDHDRENQPPCVSLAFTFRS
jgi:recA bacterial DNA recombination protein